MHLIIVMIFNLENSRTRVIKKKNGNIIIYTIVGSLNIRDLIYRYFC